MTAQEADENERVFLKDCMKLKQEIEAKQPVRKYQLQFGRTKALKPAPVGCPDAVRKKARSGGLS